LRWRAPDRAAAAGVRRARRTAPRTEVELQDGAGGWQFAVIDTAT
jgi:hypothetical protein